MENYLYIPFNSLNFNNILSTESISPQSFYEKRGFGFKRFEKNILNPFQNSILCYGKIPIYDDIKSDREEFIAYLAIPKKLVRNSIQKIISSNIEIYQLDYTIYINHSECFFITKRSSEILILKAASNRSLEVKNADNYLHQIKSIEEFKFNTYKFTNVELDRVYDLKSYNFNEIEFDKKFNKIKGFTYGYLSGLLSEQPEQIIQAKFYYQEFINVFSLLINELSTSINKNKRNSNNNDIKNYLKKLQDIIERISILLDVYDESKIDKKLIEEFNIDLDSLKSLKSSKSNKYNKSIFQIVIDFIKEKEIEYFSIEETLNYILDKTIVFMKNPSISLYNSLEDDFNSIRKIVNNKFNEIENHNNISSENLKSIPFSFSKNIDRVDFNNDFLDKKEVVIYQEIINELFSHTELSTSDDIGQLRLNILANIGKSISNKNYFENDSSEMKYLRRLYESLKSIGVGFKINETDNQSLKSIATFFNRYSDHEKLVDFMIKNNISTNGLVMGIWGSAYGYANISKIVLGPIFRNPNFQYKAEQFLNNFYSELPIEFNKVNEVTNSLEKNNLKSHTENVIKSNSVEEPKNDSDYSIFMNMIIENKKLRGNDEWIDLIESCYNQINKEKKSGELFNSIDYKINFFREILVARAKEIKGFGPAKIDETVSVFINYVNLNE
jgi:hypothetical protein